MNVEHRPALTSFIIRFDVRIWVKSAHATLFIIRVSWLNFVTYFGASEDIQNEKSRVFLYACVFYYSLTDGISAFHVKAQSISHYSRIVDLAQRWNLR